MNQTTIMGEHMLHELAVRASEMAGGDLWAEIFKFLAALAKIFHW